MDKFKQQGELFKNNAIDYSLNNGTNELIINSEIIKDWLNRIITYQGKIFTDEIQELSQFSLFESHSKGFINKLNPNRLISP